MPLLSDAARPDSGTSSTLPSSALPGAGQEAEWGLSVERLIALGRVSAVAASPCGAWLAVEVARLDAKGGKYRSDLWRVSATPGASEPIRLTRGPANHKAPRFRSDGGLLFLSNRSAAEGEGSEKPKMQVWLLPAVGGEPQPLTNEPLGVDSFRVASAGMRLVVRASLWPDIAFDKQRSYQDERDAQGPSSFHYKEMPIRRWDHWLPALIPSYVSFDLDGGGRTSHPTAAGRCFMDAEWDLSADGKKLVTTSMGTVREDDRIYDQCLVVIDLETGAQHRLGDQSYTMYFSPLWSPDGNQIACIQHARFPDRCITHKLWLFDLSASQGRVVADAWDRWGTPAVWRADGEVLYALADDLGARPIFAITLATDAVVRISSQGSAGSHESLALLPTKGGLVGIRHQFLHPPEPFWIAAQVDATPQLLGCLSGFSPAEGEAMATVSSMLVSATDGVPIQSYLVTPKEAEDAGPRPLLFWIHGGPRAQWSDAWHWRWNSLVATSQGYTVACPNPRGSTGFGHDFVAGIWGNEWGAACYQDLMCVADELVAREDIDATKTIAMGGSFGGYMSNWIGANTDRFQCIVTHASLFALSHFYGTTDLPGWAALEMQCTPFSDPEAYDRYSPHRYVANWKTPTLIIHGAQDFRVPISEALFLFESLQVHGVPSELLVFPDENHWILKPQNICVWYKSVFAFMAAQLSESCDSSRLG